MTTQTEQAADLAAIVSRALERLAVPGIEDWGLRWTSVPEDAHDTFDVVEAGPALGCTSETCFHNSHSPAESVWRLTPRAGMTLTQLGDELREDETTIAWYVLTGAGAPRFFEVRAPRNYHATITEVDADAVPEWALARLAERAPA